MLSELNLTEARKGFSSLYDRVFNTFKPTVITRKGSEQVLLLRVDLQIPFVAFLFKARDHFGK